MHATFAFALLAAAAPAVVAQLSTFRATIPGSLHQCEQTNAFFFDSNNARPLTLVFLPSSSGPSSSTVTLADALQAGPLQVLEGITTPDAQEYNFQLAIAAGVSFDTFGFLPDGSGKNLDLPRTVQTPLPGAASCNPATAGSAAPTSTSSSSGSASGIVVGPASSAQSSASRAVASATGSASAAVSSGSATVAPSSTSSSSAASGSSSASALSSATTSGAAGKLVIGMAMGVAALVGAVTVAVM